MGQFYFGDCKAKWVRFRLALTAGRRRLRRVAKVCESTGQRVQKSVFECRVELSGFEELERKLLAEIEPTQDCLRLYSVPDVRGAEVREHGLFKAVDFDGPLVL